VVTSVELTALSPRNVTQGRNGEGSHSFCKPAYKIWGSESNNGPRLYPLMYYMIIHSQ